MPLASGRQPTEEPMSGTDTLTNFVSDARPQVHHGQDIPGQMTQGQMTQGQMIQGQMIQGQAACRTGTGDP